jgi:hypothetical protein
VSHFQLVETFATIGQDILKARIIREQYAVARDGKQFFGVLSFGEGDEQALSVGFRNSYDKSMSVGIAIGCRIFVCDNLAFKGDITILKKHTRNVWQALENLAISTIYKAGKVYEEILADFDRMMGLKLDDNEAFRTFGLLYGHDIISPRQLTTAVDQWKNPPEAFKERNLYSLYNASTEALKSTPPLAMMEKHIQLHKTLEGVWQHA